ncbi:hypothetical protein [Spiroplasma endosymbiont of Virgichneumon dumeticola]|uniref:hypothetical protein n=1 Tax=Spiroplasma endosymbiont of Virgichneumon dumeticola TaxID=3139323 RepID=UPI0035C8F5EF
MSLGSLSVHELMFNEQYFSKSYSFLTFTMLSIPPLLASLLVNGIIGTVVIDINNNFKRNIIFGLGIGFLFLSLILSFLLKEKSRNMGMHNLFVLKEIKPFQIKKIVILIVIGLSIYIVYYLLNNHYFTDFSPHVLVEETMKLNEFNNTFQTEKQCLAYIASLKQSKCTRCFSFNLNTSNLRKMRCLKCHQTFSILTGTIFSKSQTPLISWFYLIFRWINTKHGIPSTDVAKELGVTLKTAWRMGHKIRSAIAK